MYQVSLIIHPSSFRMYHWEFILHPNPWFSINLSSRQASSYITAIPISQHTSHTYQSSMMHHPSFILQHSHFIIAVFNVSFTIICCFIHINDDINTCNDIIQHHPALLFAVSWCAISCQPFARNTIYRVCTLSFHPQLPEHKTGDWL